jgi:hypothetical protein
VATCRDGGGDRATLVEPHPADGERRLGASARASELADLIITDHPRPARPRLIRQALQPVTRTGPASAGQGWAAWLCEALRTRRPHGARRRGPVRAPGRCSARWLRAARVRGQRWVVRSMTSRQGSAPAWSAISDQRHHPLHRASTVIMMSRLHDPPGFRVLGHRRPWRIMECRPWAQSRAIHSMLSRRGAGLLWSGISDLPTLPWGKVARRVKLAELFSGL